MSLPAFAQEVGATGNLDIIPNKAGRVFFIVGTKAGNLAGSVSRKFEEQGNTLKKPVVSYFTSTNEAGVEYSGYLLHEQGELPEAVASFDLGL